LLEKKEEAIKGAALLIFKNRETALPIFECRHLGDPWIF
jgi:hypothetical protein